LLLPNPPLGITRFAVRATNSEGEITSDVIVLSVEPKGTTRPPSQSPPSAPHIKSAEEIERQRQRLEAEQGKPPSRKWPFLMLGVAFLAFISAAIALSLSKKTPPSTTVQRNDSAAEMSNPQHPSNAVTKDMAKEEPSDAPAKTKRMAVAFSTGSSEPRNSSNIPFSDNVTELPQPWTALQIGKRITVRTSASYNNTKGEFIIFGAGQNDYDPSDDLFFVQQSVSNSVDFTARLKMAGGLPTARDGIMIRESEKTDAPFVFVGLSQTNIAKLHRDVWSQYSQISKVPQIWLPVFLRLLKQTNLISAAYSTNGSTWVWFETNQISFSAERYLIGFAVSSGYNETQSRASFDDVRIINLSAK
jgi:hypothetical protein